MITKLIEATNGERANWGKFLVARFDAVEWARRSVVPSHPIDARTLSVIGTQGWTERHLLVLDLATGEGSIFAPWGCASADLNEKHQIWVCPLFEPFLNWLYTQDTSDLDALPDHVDLPDASFSMHGHRRQRAEGSR